MDPANFKLLLVDDEPDILEFLQYNLKKEGYQVFIADSGNNAIKIAQQVIPHLILMDVMMEDMDGVETCAELLKIPALRQCIIVFLSARNEDYTQIACFEAGADGYITKPIKPKVLQYRIDAFLKRQKFISHNNEVKTVQNELASGDIIIDRERYIVIKGMEEILLPRKEFELLYLLCLKPNKVITRDDIFNSVWGEDAKICERTIDVHIRRLRKKIGDNHISTVKGIGYKFVN